MGRRTGTGNVDAIRKELGPARHKSVEAHAAELIAEEAISETRPAISMPRTLAGLKPHAD